MNKVLPGLLIMTALLFPGIASQEKSGIRIDGAKLRDPSAGTVDIAIGGTEKGKSDDLFRMENVVFQRFGKNGKVSPGCTPGSHWDGKQWNTPTPGERDGIPVALITQNYQPLLNVPAGNGGILLPVTTRRGAWIACKLYGPMTLTLHKNTSGIRNLNAGRKAMWTEETLELPAGDLGIGSDGIWRGFRSVSWNHASTLIQSYGKGEIAYIAVLPASRIRLPADTESVEFLRLNRQGEKELFRNPVPRNATELAIVHLAPHAAQLVWKLPGGWSGGRIIRNTLKENSLTIVEHSLKLNRKETK